MDGERESERETDCVQPRSVLCANLLPVPGPGEEQGASALLTTR